MEEEWRDIPSLKGHALASNLGRIIRLPFDTKYTNGRVRHYPQKILCQSISKNGYYNVTISINKKPKTHSVHRLVAEAFRKNEDSLPQVDHIDGNRLNNNQNNLEWVSCRENVSRGYILSETKTSKYTGVHLDKNSGKWRSSIRIKGELFDLGSHKSEEVAHLKYIEAKKNFEATINGKGTVRKIGADFFQNMRRKEK